MDTLNSFRIMNDIFDNFPIFICIIENDTDKIVYCNKVAEEIFGEGIKGKTQKEVFESSFFADDSDCQKNKAEEDTSYTYHFDSIILERWYRITTIDTVWINGSQSKIITGIDITEAKKNEQELLLSANMDSMTAIYNRKVGFDTLEKCIMDVKKTGSEFTICYIDINDLKFVNDNFGHNEGDYYILTVVNAVKTSIRSTDIFARMGGDEFLIVFPTCVSVVVENIMDTVVNKLEAINQSEEKDYNFSISYGILEVNDRSQLDSEYLLNAVDNKMYCMKEEYKRSRGTNPKP